MTNWPISQKQDFLDLLDQNVDESSSVTKEYLEDLSINLVAKLQEFGIEGKVEGSFPGPVITRFEINLAPGTKASQVTNIANDLARSLAVKSVMTLLTARDRARSLAIFVTWLALVPGARLISNLVITGPGNEPSTLPSIPNS